MIERNLFQDRSLPRKKKLFNDNDWHRILALTVNILMKFFLDEEKNYE
jgi:hypothetical protein